MNVCYFIVFNVFLFHIFSWTVTTLGAHKVTLLVTFANLKF